MIVGLTGLIGSGKTTVANCFAKLGIQIVDTDLIAHSLTQSDSDLLPVLATEFGLSIIAADGSLNRKTLREIVFANDESRLKLESILHPRIFAIVQSELAKRMNEPYQIVVVPLLFKSPKYLEIMQQTIFVDSEYNLLLQRLWERSSLDKTSVDSILATQVSREDQLNLADDVIINNGNMIELERQVLLIHKKYLGIN